MAMLDIDLRPDEKKLRQFGWIALVAFALLGGLVLWKGGLFGLSFGGATRAVAYALFGVGALSGVLSFVMPKANQPLYLGLVLVTYPIGFVLSYVVLGVLFYGILTFTGLVFRAIGRDPLARRFEPETGSYWVAHQPAKSAKRYFSQF